MSTPGPKPVWWGVVLGGGSGSRMGLGYNKALYSLDGKAVIRRSAEAIAPHMDGLAVVCPDAERERFAQALEGMACPYVMVSGGETRQASVRNALDALPENVTHVLVHDGARCLVSAEIIRAAMASAEAKGSGVAAVPVKDTLKEADAEDRAVATLPRERLRAVQTPQAFALPLLRRAHEAAARDGFIGTDEAVLVERMGEAVYLTPGSGRNIKLTTPEDIQMAQTFLGALPLRIGTGYDVHRLTGGRKLILCGVEVPYELGLDGHSDADVALHALMDALLGAAALGDIGKHFPDTDMRYKGISSVKLLRETSAILQAHGFLAAQADVTIVAQRPKLAPYIPQMRANIAEALDLPLDRISVKATTTEHLGFEGRGEGISAQAVAMVSSL